MNSTIAWMTKKCKHCEVGKQVPKFKNNLKNIRIQIQYCLLTVNIFGIFFSSARNSIHFLFASHILTPAIFVISLSMCRRNKPVAHFESNLCHFQVNYEIKHSHWPIETCFWHQWNFHRKRWRIQNFIRILHWFSLRALTLT